MQNSPIERNHGGAGLSASRGAWRCGWRLVRP